MKPGSKPGSNRDRGMMQMSERGLVNDEGPKSHGKPHYDTTEAGRATQYGVTEAIPANIKQRGGASSSADDVYFPQGGGDARAGFGNDPANPDYTASNKQHKVIHGNKNATVGEFKRRTGDRSQMENRGNKPGNHSGYGNTQTLSDASTRDPRSGKSLVNSGAFGTKSQVANYGFGDQKSMSSTKLAARVSSRAKKELRDSKIVEGNIRSTVKKYKTGEKAISMGSNERTEVKGPSLNSQLLGGMQQEDPKPVKVAKPKRKNLLFEGSTGRKYRPSRSQRLSQKGKLNSRNASRLGKRGR